MIIYTVKQGDTLENIANENGVTVEQILNTNFPPNPDNLVVGQKLVILVPEVEYIVEEGDTLDSIAQKFNTSVIDILQKNPSIENSQKSKVWQSPQQKMSINIRVCITVCSNKSFVLTVFILYN